MVSKSIWNFLCPHILLSSYVYNITGYGYVWIPYVGTRVLVLGKEVLGTNVPYGRMSVQTLLISHYIRYYFSSIATLLFRLPKMHVSNHVYRYPTCSTPSFILKYYKNKQHISRRKRLIRFTMVNN